jgi:hypothetical protein
MDQIAPSDPQISDGTNSPKGGHSPDAADQLSSRRSTHRAHGVAGDAARRSAGHGKAPETDWSAVDHPRASFFEKI